MGKRASILPKSANQPTEAQVRQAEIMKKARGHAIASQVAANDLALMSHPVTVEDIGPEPDIFDKIENNPEFPNEQLVDPNAVTDNEVDFYMPEDPVEKAMREGDPYISVQVLPGPETHEPATAIPTQVNPPTLEPQPGTSSGYAPPQQQQQLDLGFVMALSSDPYKALDLARNTGEVEQAKQAIAELENVSQIMNHYKNLSKNTKDLLKLDLSYKTNLLKTMPQLDVPNITKLLKITEIKPSYILPKLCFQARNRASTSSGESWAEQVEREELAAARRAALLRKLKIPADPQAKESGFAPPSARKNNGRGAKNTRGSTRGRGARGARGGARATPKDKTPSEVFDTVTVESDESEIDDSAPIMARIYHAIVKTSQKNGMAPDGMVTAINQVNQSPGTRSCHQLHHPGYDAHWTEGPG